ncbi:MAG: hypothetical protein WCV81_02310 [Microgenomates group bacterium]|jgi:hypothetical protein
MAKVDYSEDYFDQVKQQFKEFTEFRAKVSQQSEDHQIRKRADLLNTYNHIVTFIGIVAGFGFTAIDKVENIYLFLMGEAFFVSLFIFNIFYLKQFHITESEAFQDISEKLNKIFDAKSKVYIDFFMKKQSRAFFEKALDEAVANTETPKPKPTKLDLNFLFNVSLVLIVIGGLFLLSSFVNWNSPFKSEKLKNGSWQDYHRFSEKPNFRP